MRGRASHLSTISYVIVLLTVITAGTHLYLSFKFPQPPDPIFLLNGLGYLLLVVALYAPHPRLLTMRKRVRWLLIAYTALTVVLWIFFGARTPIGYLDKVVEVLLIGLLWLENGRTASTPYHP